MESSPEEAMLVLRSIRIVEVAKCDLWISGVLLYYFKFVYSWKRTGKGLWNLSHVTMGANFKAQRRRPNTPIPPSPREHCVSLSEEESGDFKKHHLWRGQDKSKQCLKVLRSSLFS